MNSLFLIISNNNFSLFFRPSIRTGGVLCFLRLKNTDQPRMGPAGVLFLGWNKSQKAAQSVRYRWSITTTWARVAVDLGERVVSVVPEMIPRSTAQIMGWTA